jgi:Protein of unknown function (DUF3048) N-terminal domain/Protein of unknown function (DUF3048) C-terminal domain
MAGPQDTTGPRLRVTRRRFIAAAGLGLTAAGVSFAVVGWRSGTSISSVRPTVTRRPTPSATPAPTPSKGPLLDPFTGEPVKALGPVLAVKIDNIIYARPQTGLQSADIIYVIPVEGGLTRFMAVYSSHFPPVVGPVRSARQSDLDLLRQFGRPAFAWSGATPHLVPFIERAPVVDLYALTVGGYFRSASRAAPYNLYADTRQLLAQAKGASKAQDIGFRFGAPPADGTPAASYSVKYPAASYTFRWSAKHKRWLAWIDGAPAATTEGGQLGGSTVIVQYTQIATSRFEEYGGRPPYAKSIGSGKAVVLRDGRAYTVRWSRPDEGTGTTYTLPNGQRMLFAPGQTWVVLAPDSHASYLNARRV